MDLRGYLSIMRKRWLSIAIIALLGVGLGALASFTTTKSYTATAQAFIALSSAGTSGRNDALQGAQFAAERVKSYTLIVDSPDVLDPVIKELNLPYTTAQLAGMVSASNPPLTVLIDVSAVDVLPERAAQIATAVTVQLAKLVEQLEKTAWNVRPPVKVSLTNPAEAPGSPSAPKPARNLMFGFVVGLGLGLAWAVVRHNMDTTVKTLPEIEEITGIPALALILFDPKAKDRPLIATDPKSIAAEGYRTLRTNLSFLNVDSPPKAITITSTEPGDGKSTTVCNLAIMLAHAGHSVCLVEADLRRPGVATYIGLESAIGLTDVLTRQQSLESALTPWGRGLFEVLLSGPIPPNPSELLASGNMDALVRDLRDRFDYVILDAPPLLAVSDAAIVSACTDGAIIVTRYGKTTRDGLLASVESLKKVNAQLLGTVLNAVPAKKGGIYGGYGYNYGYSNQGSADVPATQGGNG